MSHTALQIVRQTLQKTT